MEINKKGQVTIFIILALLIVIFGILIYTFYPSIKDGLETETKTPEQFVSNCLKEDLENLVEKISSQGGSLNPEHYFLYNGNKLEYLCYTDEYYLTGKRLNPMLFQHIEKEIKNNIQARANECFDNLVESYEKKGYSAELKKGSMSVELLPEKILTRFDNYTLTLTKSSAEKHDKFQIVLNNNLYELVEIANSILDWESTYGDAETSIYMTLKKDLKVEKWKQLDGTTVYILTDRNTQDKFQFASRSVAWPPAGL